MAIEVDYITLGDVSARLGKPAPTLRHWTDQLEEFDVHYVLRNSRNERIYEESDIEVFKYFRDLKEEYGRRTTSKDLSYMIAEKGRTGELKLRTREQAPVPPPSNRQTDLLNQEDIKKVLESDRARQVIGYLVDEATRNLKEELIEEVRHAVREEILESKTVEQLTLEKIEEDRIKREEERAKYVEERAKWREERDRQARIEWEQKQEAQMNEIKEMLASKQEEKPSFFQRLFGK